MVDTREKIKSLLNEIELLIQALLNENNDANKAKILEKFDFIDSVVDQKENDLDETERSILSYIYYEKLSDYYEAIGDKINAKNYRKLKSNYEGHLDKIKDKKLVWLEMIMLGENDAVEEEKDSALHSKSLEEEQKVDVHSELANLTNLICDKGFFTKDFINKLESGISILWNAKIRTHADVFALHQEIEKLSRLLNEMNAIVSDSSEPNDKKNDLSNYLNEFDRVIQLAFVKGKYEFIELVNSSHDPKELLFNKMAMNPENVRKRWLQLLRLFHPDKQAIQNSVQEHAITNFTMLLNVLKKELLKPLIKLNEFSFYEREGDDFIKMADDIENFLQNKSTSTWAAFEKLKLKDLQQIDDDILLETYLREYLEKAYDQYKYACKIADKDEENFEKQIELRGRIAFCLHRLNQNLNAKLAVLIAVRLMLKVSRDTTHKVSPLVLVEIDRIKRLIYNEDDPKPDSAAAPEKTGKEVIVFAEHKSLVSVVQNDKDKKSKNEMLKSFEQDIQNLACQLFLKPDSQAVRKEAVQDSTLKSQCVQAKLQKGAGILVKTTANVVGGLGLISTSCILYEAVKTGMTASAFGGPIIGFGICASMLDFGYCFNDYLCQKASKLEEKPRVISSLNKLFKEAFASYDENNYQKFIEKLSEEYDPGKRILRIEGDELFYDNLQELTNKLIGYCFRPDGVAYLFNSIGEALISGNVKIGRRTQVEFKTKAQEFFRATFGARLDEETRKLDEKITELRTRNAASKNILDAAYFKFKDLSWYASIAKEHVEDAQKMPFRTRLDEMRLTAKLNLAVINISYIDKQTDDEAKNLLLEAREIIENNSSILADSQKRLELLTDFFFIITSEDINKYLKDAPQVSQSEAVEKLDEKVAELPEENFIKWLKKSLEMSKLKLYFYFKLGKYYERNAQRDCNQLKQLLLWKKAQESYSNAIKQDPTNESFKLAFAKCFIRLAKYSECVRYLKNNVHSLSGHSEYWFVLGIAHLKLVDYEKSKEFLTEACTGKNRNAEKIKDYLNLLQVLREKPLESKLTEYKLNSFKASSRASVDGCSTNEQKNVNVLSIDGGGIRGILPLMVLCEIEKQTRQPISRLFRLHAGTSVGGIIAAGLAMPGDDGSLEPRYSTYDMLEIFRNRSSKIFTSSGYSLISSKYSDVGRREVLKEYFGGTLLSQSINELVIPAVNELHNITTEIFTWSKGGSRPHTCKDLCLLDVLMATSAAPTFFPAHVIPNRGKYLDGGVHFNNPAQVAYNTALEICDYEKISRDRIHVLSLGTGSYIPDPLNPTRYRGQLFWATNFAGVAMSAQEGNVDSSMYANINNRYTRFQIGLDRPIALDNIASINHLLEIGREYVEEMLLLDDANSFNGLIERLLKDNEYSF